MRECSPDTDFAPAERVTPEELKRQIAHFGGHPLLREVLDALPTAIVVLNSLRQIIYGNAATLRFSEVQDLEAVLGLRIGEMLACIHAFDFPGGCGTTRFCRECGAARATQSSVSGDTAVEECAIACQKRGEVEALDLRVWSRPLALEDDALVLFAFMDISHEQRRYALERIFFHDILNTASALRGAAELARLESPDSQREMLDLLFASAERLVQEIRTQRELLAAESGTLKVNFQPLESTDVLRRAVAVFRYDPLADGHPLRIDDDAGAVTFVSDPVLLGRVLINMVKNALEASPPQGVVTLGCRADEDRVSFTVHNAGVMPESVQLQVFQRSFSTKGQGRGLGTYSMRLLSERYLGGCVSFESTLEKGTTFTVTCPLVPDA